MRRHVTPILLALAFTGGGVFATAAIAQAPAVAQPDSAEAALLVAEDARFQAQIDRDFPVVSGAMADELIYTHASGKRQTRSEYLQMLESGKMVYRSIVTTDRTAHVYGDVGVTSAVLNMVMGDQRRVSSYLAVYVKRDGRWQLTNWQTSPGPQDMPPAK